MPIFDYKCNICGEVKEVIRLNGDTPLCCGTPMNKLPSVIAMVKVKGEGGYPSRRKEHKGTSPYYRG